MPLQAVKDKAIELEKCAQALAPDDPACWEYKFEMYDYLAYAAYLEHIEAEQA